VPEYTIHSSIPTSKPNREEPRSQRPNWAKATSQVLQKNQYGTKRRIGWSWGENLTQTGKAPIKAAI